MVIKYKLFFIFGTMGHAAKHNSPSGIFHNNAATSDLFFKFSRQKQLSNIVVSFHVKFDAPNCFLKVLELIWTFNRQTC